ncbi:hypothetical protein [Streptosporangium roseum]|uniref:hypothetical protein n=1 Tax=Streptosporangium roseum TaxID=2001 RepID=UPI00332E1978
MRAPLWVVVGMRDLSSKHAVLCTVSPLENLAEPRGRRREHCPAGDSLTAWAERSLEEDL